MLVNQNIILHLSTFYFNLEQNVFNYDDGQQTIRRSYVSSKFHFTISSLTYVFHHIYHIKGEKIGYDTVSFFRAKIFL